MNKPKNITEEIDNKLMQWAYSKDNSPALPITSRPDPKPEDMHKCHIPKAGDKVE